LLSSALAFHPIHRFEDYTMIDIDWLLVSKIVK
jgi:hypothetical protein